MDKTLYSLQTTNSFQRYEQVCDLNGIPNTLLIINSSKIIPQISLSLTLNSVTEDQTWNLGSSPSTSAVLNVSFPAEIVYIPSVLVYTGSTRTFSAATILVNVKDSAVYIETTAEFVTAAIVVPLPFRTPVPPAPPVGVHIP